MIGLIESSNTSTLSQIALLRSNPATRSRITSALKREVGLSKETNKRLTAQWADIVSCAMQALGLACRVVKPAAFFGLTLSHGAGENRDYFRAYADRNDQDDGWLPKYLEVIVLIEGNVPETNSIIYAESTDIERRSWTPHSDVSDLRAQAIIERAGLMTLLPEGTHQISPPGFAFVEYGMGDIISNANERRGRDDRKVWVGKH